MTTPDPELELNAMEGEHITFTGWFLLFFCFLCAAPGIVWAWLKEKL